MVWGLRPSGSAALPGTAGQCEGGCLQGAGSSSTGCMACMLLAAAPCSSSPAPSRWPAVLPLRLHYHTWCMVHVPGLHSPLIDRVWDAGTLRRGHQPATGHRALLTNRPVAARACCFARHLWLIPLRVGPTVAVGLCEAAQGGRCSGNHVPSGCLECAVLSEPTHPM